MADEKLLLRKKIRSQRALLTAEYRDAVDCAIAHRMMDWEGYRQAETIFLYVGVKNEISTWKLIETAFRQGKIIALPKSFENGVMHFYRYHGEVAEGKYGIPEPQSEELLVPDGNSLMIVPGLAFDSFGYRLGQGGGYYDRYLTMHDAVKSVGLCRGEFFFESLPRAWNDLPVDYVITEDDLFFCKEKRSF